MTVLGAGKSSEYDFVCDLASHKVSWRGQTKQIPACQIYGRLPVL